MSAQTKDRSGGSPAALEKTLHDNNTTELFDLESVIGLDYLEIKKPARYAAPGRYAIALRGRFVDRLERPCTCRGASGECPTCMAWANVMRLNSERLAKHERA